jgi:enoyl-CoA hydratase/carnithine racemase
MTEKIISRREDGIGHVVFNNPEKRNAVSLDMWQAVEAALDRFAAEEDTRLVVLSGAGGKAFVSGADVSKFAEERSGAEAVAHYNATTARVSAKLHGFAKPTIAQITGSCVGGGVALAVCCDLRICGESSRFGIPAARLGLGYGFAGLQRLVHLIGPAFAKEMFFTARLFSAAEAYEMGLVNRVVPDDQVEGYVAEYAQTIAGNAPLTVGAVKATIGEVLKDPAERDRARCEQMVQACFASRDYVEGRQAFLEKRPPRFIGA